jgi:signal recognition particle subunit SRP54
MKSIMESMAGKGMRDRMRMVRELQQGGMLDPGGKLAKQKKGTGKRQRPQLGSKELKRRQKDRKRNLKNKRKRR